VPSLLGSVENIVYSNSENGYTVFEIISAGKRVTCTGVMPPLFPGDNLKLEGDYTRHPIYGSQFSVDGFELMPVDDVVSMQRYLGSGAIKGVKEKLAAKIIAKFGADTFRIIEEEPLSLTAIKGINERIARQIALSMEEQRGTRDCIVFITSLGVSLNLALKICREYKENIYRVLRENPYQLVRDIDGIGFATADGIASKLGISVDSGFRLESGLEYILFQAAGEGHTYLPDDIVIARTAELLGVDEQRVSDTIERLCVEKRLFLKRFPDEASTARWQVFSSVYYLTELYIAKKLSVLAQALNSSRRYDKTDFDAMLSRFEKRGELEADSMQREAVLDCMKKGIVIITGGPGTGKTTTIKLIMSCFEAAGLSFAMCAPTGRAAKRMTESTGCEAKTIHRLLEINGGPNDNGRTRFNRNEDNPLEVDAVIVDEMSMVDTFVWNALLKALVPGTRLVMVGDHNQLPSVGAGQVLKDMITSGAIPTVRLERIFRQSAESRIVTNAHNINAGKAVEISRDSKDFFFLPRGNIDVIYKHIIELVRDKLPKYCKCKQFDIQILTPMKKGALGVETLNKILQQYLNPASPKKREITFGDRVFREGDKLIALKNNYQMEWEERGKNDIIIESGTGVFNGDLGLVRVINAFDRTITVEFDARRFAVYSSTQLDELDLAYALTVHKSQGSEYPAVIIPLLSGPPTLMNRNLLYTAVTRAKSCLVIIGSKDRLDHMIKNNVDSVRYTGLCDRLAEICQINL